MNIGDGDQPLGQEFLENPYQYFQSFVRNMNNQVFLSQYQLNHLYALLLIRKESPWDRLQPNSLNFKAQVQTMVNLKVAEVKKILESLSQMYEDKLKKNTFTQLERLMNILKAKNKSIFIEKDLQFNPFGIHNLMTEDSQSILKKLLDQKLTSKDQKANHEDEKLLEKDGLLVQKQQQSQENRLNEKTMGYQQQQKIKPRQQIQSSKQGEKTNQQKDFTNQNEECDHEKNQTKQISQKHNTQNHLIEVNPNQERQRRINQRQEQSGDDREVLSLFYGIANIPNLSSLALGNCLEYSAAQRYIKFKMSKNYIMTIKNQDELSFDRVSLLKNIPSDLFIHGIFPYLTAVQLFKARGVCKEWTENVKEAWHSTFKREMFVQLMACEFCKQIEFYYKLIQLRNPFFQKISLLMHALIQIIQWDKLNESIANNTIVPQLKKVLVILLKLVGQNIAIPNLNSITEDIWNQLKNKILTLKQKIAHFLNNIESSGLSILDLIAVKVQLLDDPFMRVEQLNSQDKTPLLLVIFIKQLTLQQILKNHIYFSQEYLMKTKHRLDNISSKMPQQKGFLQGVYKIILLRNFGGNKHQRKEQEQQQRTEMPNFSSILTSIFEKNEENKPDFVLKSRSTTTNIYMDKATKFDIIFSTVKKMQAFEVMAHQQKQHESQRQIQQSESSQLKTKMIVERVQSEEKSSEASKKFETVNTFNLIIKPQAENVHSQQSQSLVKTQQNEEKSQTNGKQVKPDD